jgi:hypothetical protein
MTWALCLNCGKIKFGAICPCPNCQVHSTGNMELDICFSDHHWERQTLEELGAVIDALAPAVADPELRFWAFLHYVSVNHPEILQVNLSPEIRSNAEQLVKDTPLPPVTVRKTSKRLAMEELVNQARAAGEFQEPDSQFGAGRPPKKPWWRLW